MGALTQYNDLPGNVDRASDQLQPRGVLQCEVNFDVGDNGNKKVSAFNAPLVIMETVKEEVLQRPSLVDHVLSSRPLFPSSVGCDKKSGP